MKMKKLLCAALAALMVLALAACGEAPAEESEAPAAESEAPAVEESAASASWPRTRRWTPPPRASRTPSPPPSATRWR